MPAVVFCIFLVATFSASCTQHGRAEDAHSRILSKIRRGELQAAETDLTNLPGAWRKDPNDEWFWRFRILQAQLAISQGKYDAASAALREPVQSLKSRNELEAARRVQLAYLDMFKRRYEPASKLLDEAASMAPPDAERVRLELEVARGVLASNTQPRHIAERTLAEALRLAEKAKDYYFQAAVLNNFGAMRLNQFRFDEAIPFLEKGLDAARREKADLLATSIVSNLSICTYKLGDYERALDLRAQAADLQRKAGADAKLQVSLGEFGNMHYMQGDQAGAIKYFREALGIAKKIRDPQWIALWNVNLARAYVDTKDWNAAETAQKEIADTGLARPGARFEPAVRLNEALIAAGRGDTPRAIALYRSTIQQAGDNAALLWQAYANLGDLYLQMKNTEQANSNFEQALAVIDRTRAGILQRDYKITFLDSLIHFYRQYVDTLIEQGRYEKALAVADSSRALLLEEKLGLAERPPSDQTGFQSIAAAAGSTVLSYWIAPGKSYVWAVTADSIKAFPLPGEQQIARLVKAHSKTISDLRDPLAIAQPSSLELARTLLGPVTSFVPAGSKVIVVPDGVLYGVNFETLPSGDHYWIDDVTVAVAPSISVLKERRKHVRAATPSLLLIGDPAYTAPDVPKLPFASQEVEHIRQTMTDRTVSALLQNDAQPSAYRRSEPAQYGFIHFAAHAVANPSSPLDSFILLAPESSKSYKLYAREILDLPLDADLVTISACRSAGARSYSGEGLVGLAWAFMHAGARNVIGGLWDVNDGSTAQLMTELYKNLRNGAFPADALRVAKRSMLHGTNSESKYRLPYYWAPFQVYVRAQPWKAAPVGPTMRARRGQ